MSAFDRWHDNEEQTTDATTGGRKGVKLTQIGALDPLALIVVGRVAGMGANKYAAFNYLAGFDWSKAYNAMMRHASLWWAGEDIDEESGQPHIAHAAWMALALISFAERGIGTDDRPPRPGATLDDFRHPLVLCDDLPECGDGVHADGCSVTVDETALAAQRAVDAWSTPTCHYQHDDLSMCGLPAESHVHQMFGTPHIPVLDQIDHHHHAFNPEGR